MRGAGLPGALSDRAVLAAVAVARAHGLEVTEPRVLRDLSNVLVHLAPAPVVARVAATTAAARPDGARDWLARDVAMAGWLASRGAGVVAPADLLPPGPHLRDGLALTFWRLVAPAPERPSPARAGRALRELHDTLDGFAGALPPLVSVLDEAGGLIERLSLDGLREPLRSVREAIEEPAAPSRPLHGDAHAGNLLRTAGGLLWTDFEDTCAGPVEWDLACLSFHSDDPAAALEAYGADAEPPAAFLKARAVQVAVWTALMAEHHPQLEDRLRERLSRWEGLCEPPHGRRPIGF